MRCALLELLQIHVIWQNIPIPCLGGRDLAALTSTELESCLTSALRLRKNWTSPSPRPVRRLTFKTVSDPQSQVISISFLPGRGLRWLISLTLSTDGRVYTIQCWDLMQRSVCIAQRSLSDLRGFRVNTDASHPGILMLRSSM